MGSIGLRAANNQELSLIAGIRYMKQYNIHTHTLDENICGLTIGNTGIVQCRHRPLGVTN